MTTHGHIVPEHNRRLRQCDAGDMAAELLHEARHAGIKLALFLLPNGDFKITASQGPAFDYHMAHDERSMVGLYDGEATKAQIVDDVRVRAEQIGMEWAL